MNKLELLEKEELELQNELAFTKIGTPHHREVYAKLEEVRNAIEEIKNLQIKFSVWVIANFPSHKEEKMITEPSELRTQILNYKRTANSIHLMLIKDREQIKIEIWRRK